MKINEKKNLSFDIICEKKRKILIFSIKNIFRKKS